MEVALGMVLEYFTSVTKELKLKVRKFWEANSFVRFVEVTGKKLVGGDFLLPPPFNLNRVKAFSLILLILLLVVLLRVYVVSFCSCHCTLLQERCSFYLLFFNVHSRDNQN